MNNNIIAIIPVDPKDRMGIDYTPAPHMVHTLCEKCETKCWVGPNQLEMKKQHPELPVLCTLCLIRQYQESKEPISTTIKILD